VVECDDEARRRAAFARAPFRPDVAFAIGGANAALPRMYRLVVEIKQWMTDRQFADMYAIAQVTPGPNVVPAPPDSIHGAGCLGALVPA